MSVLIPIQILKHVEGVAKHFCNTENVITSVYYHGML